MGTDNFISDFENGIEGSDSWSGVEVVDSELEGVIQYR